MNFKVIILFFFAFVFVLYFYIIEPLFVKQKIKNNNEHGSARWAKKSEIRKNFTRENISNINKVGFPVAFDRKLKYVYFDYDTPHWTYLGSTGSGKSSTSVIPLCSFIANARVKRSVFVTDPKAEIFSKTSKMFSENGYDIITIDFRNPENSSRINILEPCILEYEKFMENKKCINKIQEEREMIKSRIKIYNMEKEYLKELKNKNIEEEYFISTDFIDYICKDENKLNQRLVEIKQEEDNYENLSIYHLAECNRLISTISSMIMAEKNTNDPFWINSAKNLLEGLIGLFLEDYMEEKISREQITLSSIKKFQNSSMTEENAEVLNKYILTKKYGSKSKDNLLSILSSSENTYKSITSVFNEKMSLFDDINVENITSSTDFSLYQLGSKPTAMYIIVPDEEKIYFKLVTIIVGLLYHEVTKLANESENKKVPYEIDFILDEFANCPPLPDIETIISVARSRGMRFHLYIQSFSQLDNVYGRDVAKTILDNCGLAYLKTNTQETADIVSKMLGTTTRTSSSISYSINSQSINGSQSTNLIGRPLLTSDEIKQLHYKTIIFPIIGHPILRNTVFYKKFSIFKDGKIEREKRYLKKLEDTYYTVEDIKNGRSKYVKKDDLTIEIQKQKLESLVQEMNKELGNINYDISYFTDNDRMILVIGFQNALSENKINNLINLIDQDKYEFNLKLVNGNNHENELEMVVKM